MGFFLAPQIPTPRVPETPQGFFKRSRQGLLRTPVCAANSTKRLVTCGCGKVSPRRIRLTPTAPNAFPAAAHSPGLLHAAGPALFPPYTTAVSMGCLAASYIGGTVNFFETARLLAPTPDAMQYLMLLAGADIVVMGLGRRCHLELEWK